MNGFRLLIINMYVGIYVSRFPLTFYLMLSCGLEHFFTHCGQVFLFIRVFSFEIMYCTLQYINVT